MKVVLFCGGLGLRMGEGSARVPKPMAKVGDEPILLHIMRYYAHYGHREFVLCLGYNGDVIRAELPEYGLEEWDVTFAETGLTSNVGERLLAVRSIVEGEELFLANYGDGLCDFPLPRLVERVQSSGKTAAFLRVRPTFFFHTVKVGRDDAVLAVEDHTALDLWVNGGYFCFRPTIFDYIEGGEELVEEPFRRLIAKGELLALEHDGFWAPMDTLKDKQRLDLLAENDPPWAVWEGGA